MLAAFLILFLTSLFLAAGLMTNTYFVGRHINNYSIVDPVWATGFTLIVFLYTTLAPGDPVRRAVVFGLVALWSLRLGTHLYGRWRKHLPAEDVRYAQLREEWGPAMGRKMFGFFQLQGLLQVLLSLPFLLSSLNRTRGNGPFGLGPLEWIGIVLWLAGLVGETIADRQLAAFRKKPSNRGKVCRVGLWNLSRHPNYFFEWLVWVGFAVFALQSPWGFVGILSPVAMWHFLVNVTGIPMTEALSVKSKGDAYREYQRTTNAFIPWPRRS
jgi:steroid 5-alpha reductase family enzyme